MIYNKLILFALSLGLLLSNFGATAAPAQKIPSNDTIPKSLQVVPSDTTLNTEMSELEKDLNELDEDLVSDEDTTRIRIGNMKVAIIKDGKNVEIDNTEWEKDEWDEDWTEYDDDDDWTVYKRNKKFKPHWAGLSLGINNFVTDDLSTSLPGNEELLALNTNNSLEFNMNIAQVAFPIVKNYFGLVTGVGFKWNNYKFRNTNTVLVSDSTPLYYYEDPGSNYKFSKLTTCYLIIPVLLEVQIPTDKKPVYFSGGIEGGLKLGTWTKMLTNDKAKHKDKSDFHTPTWDYRATARIGYGSFGVFGTLGLAPVFEKDKGPDIYPFTVGASLNF